MRSTFIRHQWTGFWRSRNKTGTIAAQVIMGFFVLYIIGVCILVGVSMEELIIELMPNSEVTPVFNGIILYYFAIEFLMRLQIQELPTLAIVPYLHLNIRKRSLVGFLNIRSLLSPLNIFPLLIFFPFCITDIRHDAGTLACITYLLNIVSLVIFNNFAALYFKRVSAENIRAVIPGILILAAIAALEYFKVFSIAAFSNTWFETIIRFPAAGLLIPVLAIAAFTVNHRYLLRNLYMDELKSGPEKKSGTDYPFLDRFGEAGMLAALEIKLILRNKRPYATVTKGLILLLYGFLFYKAPQLETNQFGKMLFAPILMTGNTIFVYGQFMFGWQAAEFDGLLARKLDIKTFFRAKFILLTLFTTILTLLTSLYAFLSWKILIIQLACYLYNIGISTVIILYVATRNYRYIDISKTARFNWQGVSSTTMLMALPFLLTPFIIYIPLSYIDPYWGLAGLALLGIAGCCTRSIWTDMLSREFNKRKYEIAAGFRERT